MIEDILKTDGFNSLSFTRIGWILYNRNDSIIGKSISFYGEYSHKEIIFFESILSRGDTVIELGSNIGMHSIPISRIIGEEGKLYALEPQRIIFQTLCANLAINSCTNVFPYQLGVADSSKILSKIKLNYYANENYGGLELSKLQEGEEKINFKRLDDIFEKISDLRLLKIDVEGMEIDAIKGGKSLIKKHSPIIFIENDRKENSKALIEIIKSLDYRLYWHTTSLFNPNNFAKENKNIFPGAGSINMVCIPNSYKSIKGLPEREILDSSMHILYGKTD